MWPAFGNEGIVMPTQARTVELQLAIYQHGYTVAAVGHLSGISRERLWLCSRGRTDAAGTRNPAASAGELAARVLTSPLRP